MVFRPHHYKDVPVEYEGRESLAVNVLGNDDQRSALSVGKFQCRDD